MSTLGISDPTISENVQSYEIFDKSGFGEVMTLVNVNPTILEECQLRMHVDRVENMFCDSYFVEFSYDLENLFRPHEKYEIDNSVCNIIESGFGRVSTLDPTYLENVQSLKFLMKVGLERS